MTLHLLERDRRGGEALARALDAALVRVGRCGLCRNLSEDAVCPICASERRDRGLLCVVETPADVLAVEQAGGYQGLYYVLLGRLSPLDGIGPSQLPLDALERRIAEEGVKEVIVATPLNVEGEATALYIADALSASTVRVSRIAAGVPHGGELEFTDQVTLGRALEDRRAVR